jgi:hypothetical protein
MPVSFPAVTCHDEISDTPAFLLQVVDWKIKQETPTTGMRGHAD